MADRKTGKKQHILLIARIAFVVCGIGFGVYWVLQDDHWANIQSLFAHINLWVFALTLAVFLVAQVIVSFRWWLLLRTQSIYIGLWAAIKLTFLGWFYNNFMPGSVGGDLVRAWYATRHTEHRMVAALSVFVDRLVGLFTTLVIAISFYSIFLRGKALELSSGPGRIGQAIYRYGPIFALIIGFLGLAVVILCLFDQGRAIIKKGWIPIRSRFLHAFGRVREMIVIYLKKPQAVIIAFFLTVGLQIMTITCFWMLGWSMGIHIPASYYYVCFTLTWVLGAVPVSVAGAGVVEGTLVYLFVTLAGIEPEAALVISLCQRLVWMVASLPGAAIHLSGTHLPKDFSIDSNQTIS